MTVGDIELLNIDCMELLRGTKDKAYSLAIVDPPYGIGKDWNKRSWKTRKAYDTQSYDNSKIPDKEYFDELFRVSKNQIIWGYNYFVEHLGPTNNLIIWDKLSAPNNVLKYSRCEIAYTSFAVPCDLIRVEWDGARMGKETGVEKIHPHQRPIELHKKLLSRYANPGDKILDTHAGSFSLGLACHDYNFACTATEIDPDYFNAACKRLKQHTAQLSFV